MDGSHSRWATPPLRIEELLAAIDELRVVFGDAARGWAERLHSRLREAAAARDRGDPAAAVAAIERAMEDLARLAATAVDPGESAQMRALAAAFRTALARGAEAEARQRADEMLARSGALKKSEGDA